MPALAQTVMPAAGSASEGLQGRKPRSAGRAPVGWSTAMAIAMRA